MKIQIKSQFSVRGLTDTVKEGFYEKQAINIVGGPVGPLLQPSPPNQPVTDVYIKFLISSNRILMLLEKK